MPKTDPGRGALSVGNLGLILALALVGFAAMAHGGVESWARATIELAILSMILVWIAASVRSRYLILYRSPLDPALLLFFAVAIGSTAGAAVPWVAWAKLQEFVVLAGFGVLARSFLRRSRDVARLATGLVVLGAALATLGLVVYGPTLLGLATFTRRLGRTAFTFANPNHFAGFLGMISALAIAVALAAPSRAQRAVFGLFAIYVNVAIVASGSRGGVVAVVVGTAVLALLHIWVGRAHEVVPLLVVIVPIALIVAMVTASPKSLGRLETIATPATALAVRFEIWRDAIALVRERPLLGFGPGAFVHVFPAWQSAAGSTFVVNAAHNDYLEIAADLGLLGLTAALIVIGTIVVAPLVRLRHGASPALQSVGFGAVAATVTLAVHASVEFHSHVPATLLLLVLVSVIAERASALVAVPPGPSPTWIRRELQARGLCVLVAGGVVVVALGASALRRFVVARDREHARRISTSAVDGEAIAALEHAHRWAPGDGDVAVDLARRLADRAAVSGVRVDPIADRDRALALVDAAIAIAPRVARFHYERSGILDSLGLRQEALGAALRAVALAPNDARGWLDLARHQLGNHDLTGAAVALRAALERDRSVLPAAMALLLQWGTAPRTLGDYVPDTAWAHAALARYLESRAELTAGIVARERVFALEPTAAHASQLVGVLRGAERSEDAIAAARRYLELFPTDVALLWQAIAAYRVADDEAAALDLYRTLARLEPTSARTQLAAGTALRRAGFCTEAEPLLERAAALDANDAHPYLELATCHRAAGRRAEMVAAWDQAIVRAPSDPNLRYHFGLELSKCGLHVRAASELEACVSIQPTHAGCVTALARAREAAARAR